MAKVSLSLSVHRAWWVWPMLEAIAILCAVVSMVSMQAANRLFDKLVPGLVNRGITLRVE